MPPPRTRPLPHPVHLAAPRAAPAAPTSSGRFFPRSPLLGPRGPHVRPHPLEVRKWQRLRNMAFTDALDPVIVEFASRLARPFAPDDYLAIVREIFRWVRDGIRYQRDPGLHEDFAPAMVVLQRGYDDCDGKIKLAVALMRALGIDADVVPVWGDQGELSHVQLRVRFPGSNRVEGNHDGWIYAEITIRGAELAQAPRTIASNPETGKLPLSGGPEPRYLKPASPLD